MALLSKHQILNADDLKTLDVSVEDWGGEVRIRVLTGAERDKFEQSTSKTVKGGKKVDNYDNFRARLVAECAINEDGSKLFDSSYDVIKLGGKSVAALGLVFNAAAELNGMTQKDVEELTEGFDEEVSESSTSA